MKKLISILLTAAMCASMMAGCSGDSGTAGTSQPSSQPASSDNASAPAESTGGAAKEVTFWHYFTSKNGEVNQSFIDEYNASQDAIKINFEFVPREELLKQLTIGLVSQELPDMAFVDNPDQASFAAMGLFADLTDRFNAWEGNQFQEKLLNSAKYDGKIYGLPHASNCLALFYDKDMLAEAGVEPPTTWTELEAAAAKLTKGNVYGFGFSAIKNEEGTCHFTPFLASNGVSFDKVDSPEGIEALTFLTNLVQKGYASKENLNWGQADVEKQFIAGNVAMITQGCWIIPNLKEQVPDKNWDVAMIPAADGKETATMLGGENIVVISSSEVVDECWDYLTWFLSKENNIKFCKQVNRLSPRSDVTGEEVFGDDKVMSLFAEQLKTAQPRGPHAKWPEISSALVTAEQEALSGVKAPEQALKDAQVKIDEINASLKK